MKERFPQAQLTKVSSKGMADFGNPTSSANLTIYFDNSAAGEMALNKIPNRSCKWDDPMPTGQSSLNRPILPWPPRFGIETAHSLCKTAGITQRPSQVLLELDPAHLQDPTYSFWSTEQPLGLWYVRTADNEVLPGGVKVEVQKNNTPHPANIIKPRSVPTIARDGRSCLLANSTFNSVSWTDFITNGVNIFKKSYPQARITNVISQATDDVDAVYFLDEFYIVADDPGVGALELKHIGSPWRKPKSWDSEPKATEIDVRNEPTLHWPPVFSINRAAQLCADAGFNQPYHYVEVSTDTRNQNGQVYQFLSFGEPYDSWFLMTVDNSVQPGFRIRINGLAHEFNAAARIGTS